MPCRFILGRAGSGKTHYCLHTIKDMLSQDPQGTPIVLLLPEQSTFIHEKMLAETVRGHGFSRVLVTGFGRLLFQSQKAAGKTIPGAVSDLGKNLIISNILQENRQNLTAFTSADLTAGFSAGVLQMVTELKMYGTDVEKLQQIATAIQQRQPYAPLSRKLHDIALIYQEIVKFTQERNISFENNLDLLRDEILHHGYLNDAHIFIDGFKSFTGQQNQIILAMIKKAARVEITFDLDPAEHNALLEEDDLFYPVWQTYHELANLANGANVIIEPALFLPPGQGRFQSAGELSFLEQQFFPLSNRSCFEGEVQGIEIFSALNRRTELEAVGRKILALVRREGLRFNQIGMMARETEPYEQLLQLVFSDLGIPYFIDTKKPLFYYPLVELIRSALEIAVGGWHYAAIFRYLKTGLTGISPHEVDRLENYCLANGIRPFNWTNQKDWTYWRKETFNFEEGEETGSKTDTMTALTEINDIRRRASVALLEFCRTLTPQSSIARICLAIRTLLDNLQVPEQLEERMLLAAEGGQGETLEIHRQAWDQVMALLAEAQELFGDLILPFETMLRLFDEGLCGLKLSLIPPGLDQVFVASLETSRNPELKAVFVLGVNSEVLPKKILPEGILSLEDRKQLQDGGVRLAPDASSRQLAEDYLVYQALTRTGERLVLSYCLSAEEDAVSLPSFVIERVKFIFPQLNEECYQGEDRVEYLAGSVNTLASLSLQLQRLRQGREIDPFWFEVYDYYAQRAEYAPLLRQTLKGLSYESQQPQRAYLKPESVQSLYCRNSNVLRTSVSRLEKFKACPFSYFAAYGLKIKERTKYAVTPMDRGQLFHEVLADIGKKIHKQKISWLDVDDKLAERLVQESLDQFLPRFLGDIFASSARYAYLAQRIKNTLVLTLLLWARHMQEGKFVPVAWEIAFGNAKAGDRSVLPSLRLPLVDGSVLEINGKIDRVDMACDQESDRVWFRIIDYKTGKQKLSVADLFAGLKMQLFVYLQVVMNNAAYFDVDAQKAKPAGMYYCLVRDDLLSVGLPADDEQEAQSLAGLRLEGMTVQDFDAVQMADPGLSGHSKLIPVAVKTSGEFYSNSQGVTAEELHLLHEHLLHILRSTAGEMLQGMIAAQPPNASLDVCQFCEYRSLCGFDREFVCGQKNDLPTDKQTIMEILRQNTDHSQDGPKEES